MDELRKITHELAKVDDAKVKAIADGDKVILMIQDAPTELRRLADALEKIDVREIRALIAYPRPKNAGSARLPKASKPQKEPKELEGKATPKGPKGGAKD